MALVNAGWSRINDDKHFRGEVLAATVENDAGHADIAGLIRVSALEELQRGHPVLTVNNKKLLLRLLQLADARAIRPRLKAQLLRREKQDRPRNGRLADGRLVKIANGADFGAGQLPLERLVVAFDFENELG